MASAEPDWALWRSFAAVVADGSLSAAARRIGYSQPTLGRHIETLEQQLGLTLFDRTLQGLKPTETALRLYQSVSAAEAKLAEAALVAEGSTGDLEGTVRITASTMVSHYILPALLRPIRDEFPAIAIEIVPSDSIENLLLRESDIAIRMFRPTQLELIAKKIGELPIIATAHASYLGAHGTPTTPDQLTSHTLMGIDRSDLHHFRRQSLGLRPQARRFRAPHRQPDRHLGTAQGRARRRLCATGPRRRHARHARPAADDQDSAARGVAHHSPGIVPQPANPCHL